MDFVKRPSSFRDLLVGLDTSIPLANGSYIGAINFDNAATTPPLAYVMDQLIKFSPWYSSIHRGAGYKSQLSSSLYDEARKIIGGFVGADPNYHSVIFVKNTSEAINKLSNKLLSLYRHGVVLSSFMEHHSNDLPWRGKYELDYISIDEKGQLCMKDLADKLLKYRGRVRLVTVTGASNVTGCINPIQEIACLAHSHGAKILVDGAQLVPHAPVNMKAKDQPDHIDFLVFSSHKMYAPFGTGVLIGPREIFAQSPPDYTGGGTVKSVSHKQVKWLDPPEREEAGSPNIMGVLATLAAIRLLDKIGMDNIEAYEGLLTQYAMEKLQNIACLNLYTRPQGKERCVSIIPFNMEGVHHDLLAKILAREFGIAVRSGCFCAHPYVQNLLNISEEEMEDYINDDSLPLPGMVRLSFGIYNTIEEIDYLERALLAICSNKDFYLQKYGL